MIKLPIDKLASDKELRTIEFYFSCIFIEKLHIFCIGGRSHTAGGPLKTKTLSKKFWFKQGAR